MSNQIAMPPLLIARTQKQYLLLSCGIAHIRRGADLSRRSVCAEDKGVLKAEENATRVDGETPLTGADGNRPRIHPGMVGEIELPCVPATAKQDHLRRLTKRNLTPRQPSVIYSASDA